MSDLLAQLKARKKEAKKLGASFACLTAYDATQARVVSEQGVEVLLVGDSLGMVVQGQPSTAFVSLADMVYHTQLVSRGNQGSLLMADVPIGCTYNDAIVVESALQLVRAGAQMVKFEADAELLPHLRLLSRQGIPVCAHFGLRPQQVAKLGGYKVQGKTDEQAQELVNLAKEAEQCGADMLLLECVTQATARAVTEAVQIPVIGIGAGKDTDSQILVLYDMLGLNPKPPRFVKNFMAEANSIAEAIALYRKEVLDGTFPAAEHWYE